jgi:hypothetical protein
MNFVRSIIKHMIYNSKELPKPLGRWRMEHCNNKTNNKVDLSNEDHCGPCGQYRLEKLDVVPLPSNVKLDVIPLSKEKHGESTK